MSETLLSLLKKKKDPVKMKKVGIKVPKKGEVMVKTTIVDKTEEASDIDMSDFRQRLKLKKNKTYKTLVNESKTQQERDADVISTPGMSIPSQLKQTELPQKLSLIEEKSEEPSQGTPSRRQEDVEREVYDIANPSASISSQKPKISKVSKISKIKSKMTLPGATSFERSDDQPSEQKEKKSKKTRTKKPIESVTLEIPATMIQVGDKPLGERLGKKEPNIFIKAPAYYMNNREIFINFLNSLFKPYSDKIKEQASEDITCEKMSEAKQKSFSLMIHQQIVRDYMNIYSPYRGLLLYHGLGAGKTCASIGIAEGLKDVKQIIIMTPASLRMNYVSELKHCGDPIYKINQHWEFIETNKNLHIEKALSEILNLPVEEIRKKGGAWMVDKKPPNFDSLEPEKQKAIDNQINKMIQKKYRFINYNGIRNDHLDKLIRDSEEMYNTSNPFDNKVIVIDEAHNFVSRIVNKIQKKKETLSMKLYELLLDAENCRIIFLTGTPIINYPNEIAILFNILRGYIKTYFIPLSTSNAKKKVNQKKIMSILKKNRLVDYIEYKSSSNTLVITRNPFGFGNRTSKEKYKGVSKGNKGEKGERYFLRKLEETLKDNDIEMLRDRIRIEKFKALPDTLDEFNRLFIDTTKGKFGELKEVNLLKRRILGLTSYFRSAQESLLPKYDEATDLHIVKIPMSNFQLGAYEDARNAERKEETRNARKRKKAGDSGIYGETTSTYRIFSRAFCNFVFPNEIVEDDNGNEVLLTRPMPKENKKIKEQLKVIVNSGDEDLLDGENVQDRLDNIDGRHDVDEAKEIKENIKENTNNNYGERIDTALNLLKKNGEKFLTREGLEKLSPKFLKLLENIVDPEYPGLHLIYSQFRTLEGIGIFSMILEENGFARFKIKKNAAGLWDLNMSEEDIGKPTYALYTGTEEADEKEIVRNIFNGTWDSVPSSLASKLRKMAANNNMGEVIKVIMITSSGAEGITLRNTRYVHIVEPYWHPVRTEQVIGRARRICSHQALAEEYKTVEVFMYLMTFTQRQLEGDPQGETQEEKNPLVSVELKLKDKSKLDTDQAIEEYGSNTITTDEALYEISNIKKNITSGILKAVKESSMDCALHSGSNAKEGIACYSFGNPPPTSFSYKPSYGTEEKEQISKINKKQITWKAYPIKIKNIKYALKRTDKRNKKIGEVYDLASYNAAKDSGVNPILIGRIAPKIDDPSKIRFIKVGDPDF
tara:strand:+ start:8029 stop:11694 length:3666 start_codon:yes stop_codon:yes gene_type:complete